jgi:prevent-host-death family protein
MDARNELGSDAEEAVREGFVSVRDLSRNATQILRAVEKLGRPVLITRHGRIVATLAPVKARDILNRALDEDAGLHQLLARAREEHERRIEGA